MPDPTGRFKDMRWNLADADGTIPWERVQLALLMDIRDELQQINRLLRCPQVVAIPATLRKISRNTAKRTKPRRTPERR